jgi:syntaxin-binding protein 1
VLEDQVANQLSIAEYPSVMPMPDAPVTPTNAPSARGGARSARGSARRGEAGSARKSGGASSRWSKSSLAEGRRSSGPTNLSGARCIVFFIGGVSYAEIKVAREMTERESREIIVGSTTFLSPKEFVNDLTQLGKDDM